MMKFQIALDFISRWFPIVGLNIGALATVVGLAALGIYLRSKVLVIVAGAVLATTIAFNVGVKHGTDERQKAWDQSSSRLEKRIDRIDNRASDAVRRGLHDPWDREDF